MDLREVDLKKLYCTCRDGLEEFEAFVRSSPFVSLQTYNNFTLKRDVHISDNKEIIDIVLKYIKEKTFIIIDLDLDRILDIALILNNEHNIKPILNINLLFHPYGIVGNVDEISKLIINTLSLNRCNSKERVMLIPYNRYEDTLDYKKIEDKLNNQYGIGEDDLPYEIFLKKLGYDNVIIITKERIKGDLSNYFDYIKERLDSKIIGVK